MRATSLPGLLDRLSSCTSPEITKVPLTVDNWITQRRAVAVCMGLHKRLGRESLLAQLDPAVMDIVLDAAGQSGGVCTMAGALARELTSFDNHQL